MHRFRTWLWLLVLLPVLLLVGGLLFVWGISREPELNHLPLSEHLLKLQLSDKEVRSETLKLIVDHQALFGPYCLDLVANGPSSIEHWTDQFQSKYGSTVIGRKLGIKSPLKKYHARSMAAVALGVLDVGEGEKLDAFRSALFDEDRGLRMEAAKGLAHMGPVSLGLLEESLGDPNPGVRNAGVYGMYLLGPEARPALETLIQLLLSKSFNVDGVLFEVFGRIGEPAVAALIEAMGGADAQGKSRILRALVPLGRQLHAHQNVFISALRNPDSEVRKEAANALMAAGFVDAKTMALLFPLLKDPDPGVRLAVLRLLNSKVPYAEPALADLVDLLTDDHKEIREMAGLIIDRIPLKLGGSKSVLDAARHSEFAYVREVAESRLSKIH